MRFVVAYTVLALWAVITPTLFLFLRPATAAIVALLGASLLLPNKVGIDLPTLPPLGKEEIASIVCLLSALWFAFPKFRRARLGRGPELFLVALAIGTVGAVITNLDSLSYGMIGVSGLKTTDVLAKVIEEMLRWGVPFVIGKVLFENPRDARNLLIVLALAGIGYSLLILFELRMSPQLHRWTYGFHQHSFSQTKRDWGYRPMVFMRHGLHVALFIALSLTATASLARLKHQFSGVPAAWAAAYLTVILVLCKSIGALAYALFTAPLILFTTSKMQMRGALLVALAILVYPFARTVDIPPTDWVYEVAESAAGPQRAKSLTGRLLVETEVIDFTMDRIWLGWGSAGRAIQRDPVTGKAGIVFDGFWVVSLGRGGIFQVASVFGLLLFPVFMAARAFPKIRSPADRTVVAGISLLVVINVVDLLPNSTIEGFLTLLSGALAGVVPGILRNQAKRARQQKVEGGGVRVSTPKAGLGDGLLGAKRSTAR